MRTQHRPTVSGWLTVWLLLAGLASAQAHASVTEVETNDSCATAQDAGDTAAGPIVGTIDESDVDFFKVTAPAGAYIEVDLKGSHSGAGTLSSTTLGVFDKQCSLIGYDAYADSSVRLRVPNNGQLVLAAAGYPDSGFTGAGTETGTYQLSVSEVEARLIWGDVIDSSTGEPVGSDAYAGVYLYGCDASGQNCTAYINGADVNPDGSFAFDISSVADGLYELRVYADGNYDRGITSAFSISGTDDVKKNVKIEPVHPFVENLVPCEGVVPGGSCTFTYDLYNPMDKAIKAIVTADVAGTSVNGGPWGSNLYNGSPYLWFGPRFSFGKKQKDHTPIKVKLQPGETTSVTQTFKVPKDVFAGSSYSVWLRAANKSNPMDATNDYWAFNLTLGNTPDSSRTEAGADLRGVKLRREAEQRIQAKRSRLAARSGSAASSSPIISGSVINAETGAAVTNSTSLRLSQCVDADDELCTINTWNFTADQLGQFAVGALYLETGDYQFVAFGDASGETFGVGYSKVFHYDAGTSVNVPVKVQPLPAHITHYQGCGNTLPVGTNCTVQHHDVRHHRERGRRWQHAVAGDDARSRRNAPRHHDADLPGRHSGGRLRLYLSVGVTARQADRRLRIPLRR